MSPDAHRPGLSKTRYVSGLQCHNKLWWEVHEPDAPELRPGPALLDRFEQGRQVGELARERYPGGVLIDLPWNAIRERVSATRDAISSGAPAIFEASFVKDSVFVAVDILERVAGGFDLIEVKSSKRVKDEHIPDAAVQVYVLRSSGLAPRRVKLMHLNPEYRHPGRGDLFATVDVTDLVADPLQTVPLEIEELSAMLAGEFPDVPFGSQCADMRDCPFRRRCWPDDRDHVLRLSGKGVRKALELMAEGYHRIQDLPDAYVRSALNQRQRRALRQGDLVVEPGLRQALEPLERPVGFLDFETVARAVPVWEGLAPWGQIPAQFSYHERQSDGSVRHAAWLADGPEDPRRDLALALIRETRDARSIVGYTSFESTQLRGLAAALPDLATQLEDIARRLFDLHRVVKEHVYHPDFIGSFSLKDVLPVLVPGLSWDDIGIQDGGAASAEIARLMLRSDDLDAAEKRQLREELLAYCELDTLALLRLLESLESLARSG